MSDIKRYDVASDSYYQESPEGLGDWVKYDDHIAALDEQKRALLNGGPVPDMCDFGHAFAKLPNHPMRDGQARCPYCMARGLDAYRAAEASGELLRRGELVVFLKALQQASDMAHSERPDPRHGIAKLAYQSVIDHINTKKA